MRKPIDPFLKIMGTSLFFSLFCFCKPTSNANQNTGKSCAGDKPKPTALSLAEPAKPISINYRFPIGGVLKFNNILKCSKADGAQQKGIQDPPISTSVSVELLKGPQNQPKIRITSNSHRLLQMNYVGESFELQLFATSPGGGFYETIPLHLSSNISIKSFFEQSKSVPKEIFPEFCTDALDWYIVYTIGNVTSEKQRDDMCILAEESENAPDFAVPSPPDCIQIAKTLDITFDVDPNIPFVKTGQFDKLLEIQKGVFKKIETDGGIAAKAFTLSNQIRQLGTELKEFVQKDYLYFRTLGIANPVCEGESKSNYCNRDRSPFLNILKQSLMPEQSPLIDQIIASNYAPSELEKLSVLQKDMESRSNAKAKEYVAAVEQMHDLIRSDPGKLALLTNHVPNVPNPSPKDIVFAPLPLGNDPKHPYTGMLKFLIQGPKLRLIKSKGPNQQNLNQPFHLDNLITFAGIPVASFGNEIDTSGGANVVELPKRNPKVDDERTSGNSGSAKSSKDSRGDGC